MRNKLLAAMQKTFSPRLRGEPEGGEAHNVRPAALQPSPPPNLPRKRGRKIYGYIACFLLSALAFPALAVERPLDDPAQEARAYALFHQVRCVVCQTDSLADSPADVAMDIRQVIRVRVSAGDSDDDIKNYLASRYGKSVSMYTPLTATTAALWFGPGILIGLVVVWILISLKKRKR